MALLILSLLPLAVFVYLGSQSRLMGDDYTRLAFCGDLGPWETLLRYRSRWSGGYSNFLLHCFVAPWGQTVPRVTLAIIIAIWLGGLTWLSAQGLSLIRINRHRLLISGILASFIVGATINAIIPLSIFYYTALVPYTLSLALFTVYTAAMLHLVTRIKNGKQLALVAIAGSLYCFVNAGLSEIYLLYQLGLLTLALAAIFAFMRSERRPFLLLFGSGWLGTVASLAVQWTAPGTGIRRARIQEVVGLPSDSVVVLAFRSVGETLQFVYDSEIFAGFILLFCVGLYVMLAAYQPSRRSVVSETVKLTSPALVFGILAQLICIPLVFSHISDFPQVLGRFSYGYSIVVIINGGLLLGLASLLLARKRINLILERSKQGFGIVAIAPIFIVLFLFSLTQLRPIHWRAIAFFLISCHMLLMMLTWLLLPKVDQRKIATYLLCVYGASLAITSAVILAELSTNLRVIPRTLTLLPYCMVLLGLFWGLIVGYALRQPAGTAQLSRLGSTSLKLVSLCAALAITGVIVGGNAQWIPPFETFAREWDARHEYIIAERDRGQRRIVVSPLSFDMEAHLTLTLLLASIAWCLVGL